MKKKLLNLAFSLWNRQKNLKLDNNYHKRAHFLGLCFGTCLSLILVRYAYLAFLPNALHLKLKEQAAKQFETEITLAPPRASIVDRNGRPLAISVLKPSLFIVPKRIPKDPDVQKRIMKQLKISPKQMESLLTSSRSFAWLYRRLEPHELTALGDLSPWKDFIGIVEEPKRVYPEKELGAHWIGFVGIDNIGLEGVEAIYNSYLNGEVVKTKVLRDARGRLTLILPNGAIKPEPTNNPLKISMDVAIQYFTETALREGVLRAKAKGGSAVVMDVETGEILAIASYPTYDLNNPPHHDPERKRFRPVMDALELGSVVKPIFIARALELKVVKPTDQIFCENGSMPVPGGKIRDTHPHGLLTPEGIIRVSSNIGTYKIMQRLGRQEFYRTVILSGLGRAPGSGFPGEWPGRVHPPETWREMRFANMSFGQGIAISPLQLTHAMSIVAGGGIDRGVRILYTPKPNVMATLQQPTLSYISPETSRLVVNMMRSVVHEEGGTGRLAAIPGVQVFGKTGTAQKYSPKTRSYSERIASFVGGFPVENPKIVITVVIDEPAVRPAYGGSLAGPVFSAIGTHIIRYLHAMGKISLYSSSEEDNTTKPEKIANREKTR